MNLKDKVVVITGAGSGIGAATAKLFGAHKAIVVVSDINLESAEKVASEIRDDGGKALALATDVTQFEQVNELLQKVIAKYDSLDVMVNNAGIGGKQQAKTADHTLEDWHNVIAVNQTGVFYCMKLAIQQMLKQGYGNIVNVASLAG
ncbi:MAG: NAD(P)-dependent dehydrogenase (short-subunit alcohol dehydrogenase family), partial [Sediminicola sp.]